MNSLAAFGHKRKRTFPFLVPVSANIRVSKVIVSHGLDVDNVHELAVLP
jgi:hypothetical protein